MFIRMIALQQRFPGPGNRGEVRAVGHLQVGIISRQFRVIFDSAGPTFMVSGIISTGFRCPGLLLPAEIFVKTSRRVVLNFTPKIDVGADQPADAGK